MPEVTKTPKRDEKGRFISVTKEKVDLRKKELPLVDLKVTNPITYIKSWWKRVMGREGIDFRLKVRPITAIAITIIVVSVAFGLGRFVLPFKIPFFEQTPKVVKPTPAGGQIPLIFRDTAFSGTLKYSSKTYRYYLLTSQSEAVNLQVPENVDLKDYLGERVFATGKYNDDSRTLVVGNAKDLEILPEKTPIPTSTPTPTPTPFPTDIPLPTESEVSPTQSEELPGI